MATQSRTGYIDSVRAHFPCGTKSLRACIQCRVVMEKKQFVELGCPQCPDLKMRENEQRVSICTTQNFEGFIANIRPGGFSTRFTGLDKSMPGLYALSIGQAQIPAEVSYDEADADLPGFINDAGADSDSSASGVDFGKDGIQPDAPPGKRRKTGQAGMAQPGSRHSDSSTSDAQPPMTAKVAAALAFAESGSEAESDKERAKAVLSATDAESRVITGSEGESDAQRAAAKQQVVASGTSASDTQASGREKHSNVPSSSAAESGNPSLSGTSRGSVAILEPEVDAEFEDR